MPPVAFARRKEMLQEKAHELATRCGVDVAVLCDCAGYDDDPLVWPSEPAVRATVGRFNSLAPEKRERHLEDSADRFARCLENKLDDVLVMAPYGAVAAAAAYESTDHLLRGLSEEELRELLASIDGSLAAVQSRAQVRQPQSGGASGRESIPPGPVRADEVTAGRPVVSLGAWGASNGTRVHRQGKVDAGGDVSAQNPRAPNAAAFVAGPRTAERSVPTPARDPGSVVRRRLFEVDAREANPGTPNAAALVAGNPAKGGDESRDVHVLPVPGDAEADDAEWSRDLVEALKEKPPSAAPYWCATEYVYNGGVKIERDADDFIRYDLGITPPYIGTDTPDSDDDGEPFKLWSWQ